MKRLSLAFTFAASLWLAGCEFRATLGFSDEDGGEGLDGCCLPPLNQDAGSDAGGDARPDGGSDGGLDGGAMNIAIYVVGDLGPRPPDQYSGQTPRAQSVDISRFELLRSQSDPAPVTVFDHGSAPVRCDLLGTTLAGKGSSDRIPAGSYTHGRALMGLFQATVEMTAHASGSSFPGTLTVTQAINATELNGQAWPKGKAEYAFDYGVGKTSSPGLAQPLPSTAGGVLVEEGSRTWLVFPFSVPFLINPGDLSPRTATIVYYVHQSFRWEDQPKPGFDAGVFDYEVATNSTEPVRNFGARGYITRAQ